MNVLKKLNIIYKNRSEYIAFLNFYLIKYKDNKELKADYDLMVEIINELVFNYNDTWESNFDKDEYKNHAVYYLDKRFWNALKSLYEETRELLRNYM